jgi:murein DD-endopeptidase MepM/ murein hydrolase activator NlpD
MIRDACKILLLTAHAISVCLAAVLFLTATESLADIFRYVDENGVECFTDTPTVKNTTRIIKEQRKTQPVSTSVKTLGRIPAAKPEKSEGSAGETGSGFATVIPPVQGVISSPVGLRLDPIDGHLRHHNGVDIAVPEGTPVKPVAPGTVSFSGFRPGYGNTVTIAHDDGMVTTYAHNSVNLAVEGARVTTGSTIALSGSTGRSTGPHLHFEAWRDGVNLTSSFFSGMPASKIAGTGLHRPGDGIHRILQDDGTLLFTNLR